MNNKKKQTTVGLNEQIACNMKQRSYTLKEAASELFYFARNAKDVFEVAINGRLEPAFREEIMVAVSKANSCAICNFTHHDFSLAAGVSEGLLSALENESFEDLSEKKRAAIDYAIAYSACNFGAVSPDLSKKLQRFYTEQECRDIELVARFITLPNLTVNKTYDLEARLSGKPAQGSSLIDELALSAVVGVVAPVMMGLVAYYRGDSLFKVTSDYFSFAKTYKAAEKVSA